MDSIFYVESGSSLWYNAAEIVRVYLQRLEGDELFLRAGRILRDHILCQNSCQMIGVQNLAISMDWQLLTSVEYPTLWECHIFASPPADRLIVIKSNAHHEAKCTSAYSISHSSPKDPLG